MTTAVRRVAALYDVHGNLPALEAVLSAVEAFAPGVIVIGGDVVPGPMPEEVLERLLALGDRARFIRGNTDRLVVDAFDGRLEARLPPGVREAIEWSARRLERRHRDFLAALPETLTVSMPALGELLFCHGSPRSDEEMLTRATPADRVRAALHGVKQATVVCGHTHMPFDRTIDGVRVVNAGSVGMPFGAPGAHWLYLDDDVRPVRTGYDLERAAERVRATDYPQAGEFAERSILRPRSEEEALALFEGAAQRTSGA